MTSHENDLKENGDSLHDDNRVAKKSRLSIPISNLEIREEFAHHDPLVARINNGSFGSCPASILEAQRWWQLLFLKQPDDFYFNRLQKGILKSRTLIKEMVNADDVEEISLVDNATTAAAIVLQQIGWGFSEQRFHKGDAVVMLHYAYGSVKKSIQAYVTRAGAKVVEVELPFPVSSNDEIILEFRRALEKAKSNGRRVRLAVIDHITSMPSVLIPVKELTKICKEEGVDQVFIDAAHSIGNVEINVKEIGADFYTSNLHKWFFSPPSVAFLYCKKSSKVCDLHHPVVSHEYGNGLAVESSWIGTRDYSSQLVVPSIFEFVSRFEGGIEGIRKKNHDSVVAMGQMLANAWGTKLGTPSDMCSSMIMVGLPSSLKILSEKETLKLRTHLRNNFGVEVPIYFQKFKEGYVESPISDDCTTAYARISHQIYNTVEDYYKLRDAINKLVQDGFVPEMLPA